LYSSEEYSSILGNSWWIFHMLADAAPRMFFRCLVYPWAAYTHLRRAARGNFTPVISVFWSQHTLFT
jgi:hypothetical protein